MGKSSGDQTVTSVTDLPSWYTDTAQVAMDQAKAAAANIAQPYQGSTVAGLDPITQSAINASAANVGSTNAGYSAAQAGATSAMNYDPMMVSGNYQPLNVNSGNQDYGYNVDRVTAGQQGYSFNPTNVTAGSFLQGNIDAYMNPYVQQVEQAAISNLNQAYHQNLNTIGDAALNAKAFGGSRQGIAEGVAAAENARQMGDLSAQLRSQAFTEGSNLMNQDFDRSMEAQKFNSGQSMQNAQFGANIGMQNIQNQMQADLANQQTGMQNAQFGANIGMQNIQNQLQAQQLNQTAGLKAADLNQQASLANQSAGLQGAQLNLEAATQLGALTGQTQDAYLKSIQQAIAAGQLNEEQAQKLLNQEVARYDATANIPLDQLNILMAALTGTQVPTSTTTTTPTSSNWLTGLLGGAATVAGFL